MNETLYDLEQKRNAVEIDIQALYETLQQEINEVKTTGETGGLHSPYKGLIQASSLKGTTEV